MKDKLLKMLGKKNERKQAINAKADACENVEELRQLNTELDAINTEIRSLEEMIAALPDDNPAGLDENGQALRTQVVNGQIPGVVISGVRQQQRSVDAEDMEYRKAFQQLVTRGTEIPAELRADASTTTGDIGSAIPTTLVNRIVEKMESIGMILPLVTRTSYASGVAIPTSSVKPVATWVAEGATSDKQKKTTGTIIFANFKLRCEISMSVEASTMAISAFETAFVRQVTEAMVKAIEGKIVSTSDGTAAPKGILAETPATGQALEASELNYQLLVDAEAAIPQAYESGAVWCMTKKTFMGFIGMVDSNKQPIARVTYGIGGAPERTLLGRTVVLCGDYMDNFSATLTAGTIFAFIFKFSDYALNTLYDMGVQRKQDWDTEELLTKAVMAVDGKVVDKNSLVTIATPKV